MMGNYRELLSHPIWVMIRRPGTWKRNISDWPKVSLWRLCFVRSKSCSSPRYQNRRAATFENTVLRAAAHLQWGRYGPLRVRTPVHLLPKSGRDKLIAERGLIQDDSHDISHLWEIDVPGAVKLEYGNPVLDEKCNLLFRTDDWRHIEG